MFSSVKIKELSVTVPYIQVEGTEVQLSWKVHFPGVYRHQFYGRINGNMYCMIKLFMYFKYIEIFRPSGLILNMHVIKSIREGNCCALVVNVTIFKNTI